MGAAGAWDRARGDEQVGWDLLVPRLVNPAKVIIIEAMPWIDRPLSATELEQISGRDPGLQTLSYHLKNLEELGVLKVTAKRKARGSRSSKRETFFYFTGAPGDFSTSSTVARRNARRA